MNDLIPIRFVAALGLSALLALGSDATAQQRVGSDGRALDANQQVGSAGFNPADGRLDFSRQNDIITGNVGGGRGFQDTIDYGAVGEFQDFLGTDALFDFRARSLSSSPSYLNAASVGGVGPQSNISIYRSFTNRSAQPRPRGLVAPDGGAFQLVPVDQLYSTPGGRFSSGFDPQLFTNRSPGRALQAFSSSPALGLRGQLLANQALSRRLYEDAQEAGVLEMPANMIAPSSYDARLFDPFGKQRDEVKTLLDLRPGQVPPTLIIGQQLQTLIDPEARGSQTENARRNQLMLDAVFRPLLKQEDPSGSGDTYLDLLRAIKKQADHPEEGPDEGVDTWMSPLEEPTSQQVTEAELAYAKIMKELYGEDYQTTRGRRTQTDDDAEEPDSDGGVRGVRGVVDQLNYDLPRLETLASNRKTRIAQMTREAEAALANGKYLSAESRYRQIILDTDKAPLARIGLVHAQLGAGMFRSAGMNLRAVFIQHPELIAARYDAKLLPPSSRLSWVQQELQTAISQGEGGPNAPILLAYLGYQASSRQVVRYGLALAQTRSPRDPLLAVLREIWLDESAPTHPSKTTDGN